MDKLLTDYSSLNLRDDGKVLCSLTGHEMPAREDVILQYVAGKRYKKAKDKSELDDLLETHKLHIVPSDKKGRELQLFCRLTNRHVNKSAEHVRRHISGRRFQKELDRYREAEARGEKHVPLSVAGRMQMKTHFKRLHEIEKQEEQLNQVIDDFSDLNPLHGAEADVDELPEATEVSVANGSAPLKRKSHQTVAKKEKLHERATQGKRKRKSLTAA